MVAPIEDRSATGSGGGGGPASDSAAVEADLAWRITRLEQLVAALGLLLERFRGSSSAFGATVFDNLDDPAASNAVLAILVESTADARRDLNAVRRGVRALAEPDQNAFDHPVVLRLQTLAGSAAELTDRFEEYRRTIGSATPARSPSTVARLHQVVALSVRSLLDIREIVRVLQAEDGRLGLVPAHAPASPAPDSLSGASERRPTPAAAIAAPIGAALWRAVGRRRTRLVLELAAVLVVGFVVLISALGRGGLPPASFPTDGASSAGPGATAGEVAIASGAPSGSPLPSSAAPQTPPGPAPPPAAPSAAPPPPRATPRPTPAPGPTHRAVAIAVTRFADRVAAAAGSIDGLLDTVAAKVQDADFAAAKTAADGIAAIALTERSWLISHGAKACFKAYQAMAMSAYGELLVSAATIATDADAGDASSIHNDVAHSHLEVSTLKQAGTKALAACA